MKKQIKKQNEQFIKYLEEHPDYRLFQAMRNFIQETVDPKWNWLCVSDGEKTEDTFHWGDK